MQILGRRSWVFGIFSGLANTNPLFLIHSHGDNQDGVL